jgi:uncharacterized protein (TIGR00369 family)
MSVTTEDPEIIGSRSGHGRCLLCGKLNPKSLNLSFHAADSGVVKTQFQAPSELQGYDGILHGGVIAALLDAAMTHCLFHRGVQAVTGDLHVRFVQPVACNVMLDIRAWVLLSHPPLYRLKAEIVVDGHVLAWGEAKFLQHRVHL